MSKCYDDPRPTIQERLRWLGGAAALESADEIDRLSAELDAWKNAAHEGHPNPCTLGPLCPYCEIDRLRAELAEVRGTLSAEKTICEARRIQTENLRAELAEKDKRIEKLVSKRDSLVRFDAMKETLLRQANARIAELETHMEVGLNPDDQGRLIIHPDQINAAWELWSKYKDMGARAALAELGIKACEECEGVGVGVSEHCTNCSGNGWVMEER